ncbi:MarR family winged helix-turn-helix transcriptional regulator [Puia sp. P3]|uniref:MarR family winged helix-turn-helix transcriptional regulator n=1 Tax=Puia sp. P3 TaxID=3423952 RepID=UPI003D665159
MTGFARWILAETAEAGAATTAKPDATSAESAPTAVNAETDTTARTILLITRLHRILQFRSKPIVKYLGFTKPQEFAMLVQAAIMNNPNKKQLCQEMLIEGSTGVEITKRLAAKGFLKETPDADDRRSALLSLTEKGKQTLLQGYTKLNPVHAEFLATLTGEEKKQLVSMLARLNEYHTRQLPPLS